MKVRSVVIAETIFLALVFLLVNIRSLIFWSLYPPADTIAGPAWREILLWLVALALMVYLLIKHNLFKTYLLAWRQQPLLIVFIVFSLASIFWSNTWTVTLHRSLAFTFATLAAVYLGVRYSINKFLQMLFLLGAIILTASYMLIWASPALGTAPGHPYYGAWRGIFWHKNQLGNIMPIFTLVFLIRCFSSNVRNNLLERIAAVLLYILSMIIIFFANSASGFILVLVIHLAFGLLFLWLKLRLLMRPVHYYAVLIVFLAGAAGALLNLEFILGLFNRTPTFTGRIPMWTILLRDVFPQEPWGGYGFGTIWADENFRYQMRDQAGWPYPILIGDNGFLDILLNLGIIGLALFLLNYIKAWLNSVRFFQKELTLEGFFPFMFMIYTFFANLTLSLFMETEVFVWTLIVTLMVGMTRKRNEICDVK
ncbi:MAG: O-antigen ligase family protein [Anaerolineales bacterium]|nr:O-antigen ligase family protein [Anaerolineales bacterium]